MTGYNPDCLSRHWALAQQRAAAALVALVEERLLIREQLVAGDTTVQQAVNRHFCAYNRWLVAEAEAVLMTKRRQDFMSSAALAGLDGERAYTDYLEHIRSEVPTQQWQDAISRILRALGEDE